MADVHFLLHPTSRRILSACGCGALTRSTEIIGKTGKTWLIGLMAGAAVYAIAGFLIAPRAIKLWIESPNVSGPACRLLVQQVHVNPFTLFLSLNNVTLFGQENKLSVSAISVETQVLTIEMFRVGKRGRDMVIRHLVVTSSDSAEAILAVPKVTAEDVMIGAGGGLISAAVAHLDRPEATISRNRPGILHSPAWPLLAGGNRDGTCITLDRFAAVSGQLKWTDDVIVPSVQLELRDVAAEARRMSDQGAASTEIDVEGRIGASGNIKVTARLRGPPERNPALFLVDAGNIDLQPLSPYFRRQFGRNIVAGLGDASMRLEQDDATFNVDNRLTIVGLELGDPDAETTEHSTPLELALALVTDETGRSTLSFQHSVSGSQSQSVPSTFADSVTKYLGGVAAKPFEVLAGLAGDADASLGEIAFLPGSAEMAPAATDALAQLAVALGKRPGLGIRVRAAYDPAADRDAIATQQVRLHIALATSDSNRERGDDIGPDFNDPRVRDILDEFANARLSNAQRRAIARQSSNGTTRYRNVFRALVANEPVSATVLRRLARFRATSVIDALGREGIERDRLRIADALDTMTAVSETVSLRLEAEARVAGLFGEPDGTGKP